MLLNKKQLIEDLMEEVLDHLAGPAQPYEHDSSVGARYYQAKQDLRRALISLVEQQRAQNNHW